MAHGNRPVARTAASAKSRDRHGRGIRAAVTGPRLPLLRTRSTIFESTVAATAAYLKELWPEQLSTMRVEIADLPTTTSEQERLRRWAAIPSEHCIVLYRLPIERLARLHRNDDLHRRMLVESCVFRAAAELLGKDPWELAPERFRHS